MTIPDVERFEDIELPAGRPVPVPAAERRERGRSLRQQVHRRDHAGFVPSPDRPDPLAILEAQHEDRVAELVPIRWGRMLHSPFTFYRGAAAVMAYDLSTAPTTGIDVQVCGDAHLLNFGLYATPERRLVFGPNDFDETIRGPWEWDVKRLAASLAVAARSDGMTDDQARLAAEASARSYRLRLAEYSTQRSLEVWYATVDSSMVEELFADQAARRGSGPDSVHRLTRQCLLHDSVHAFLKLTDVVDGRHVIRHQPPLISRMDDHPEVTAQLHDVVLAYLDSLSDER
ncbi:MAG: DUF2252 family protein, partial [Acidimicrobiales bacterium]